MREILFRGKRIDSGEWVYGVAFPHDNCGKVTMFRQNQGDGALEGLEVLHETVGQYTGLTDKNGKKIFEGDIIHLEYSQVFFGGVYFGEYTAEVSYKEGCFITDGINNGDEIETPLSGFNNDEVEIIGNIHDNPELLEVTERGYNHRSGGERVMEKDKKRKRDYFRKCGVCGRRFNQKDMIRDEYSDNGWICTDCHNDEYHDQEIDDF